LSLDGVRRLSEAVSADFVKTDEDLECMQNALDSLAVCILDGEENHRVFSECGGYSKLLHGWLPCRFLRHDALKLLNCLMTVCPSNHTNYLITDCAILPVVFGLLMHQNPKPSKKKTQLIAEPVYTQHEIASQR
jgi:hypothetical protein